MRTDHQYLGESKNVPTNKELWSRAKAAAGKKFSKHSAYKMAWASKWYKSKGGGWKVDESVDLTEELKIIVLEDLRDWFEEKWKRITTSGKIAGECGTSKDKTDPDRCLPANKAHSLTRAERAATAKKKRTKSGRKQVVSNTKKAKVKVKR